MPTEAAYQSKLIKTLKTRFPGCQVLRNDPTQNQGIPDLLVLIGKMWAMLEVKLSEKSPIQPNQKHLVSVLDEMSFASFISPETEERVLDDLQQACRPRRKARVS